MILRIHYNFDLKGGAEYDILKLMDVFDKHGGDYWQNYLLLITADSNKFKLKLHHQEETIYFEKQAEVSKYLEDLILKLNIKILHIHSQPSMKITKMVLNLKLPVFRSMHEAMIICPGWSKYWLTEDKPCEISFGTACLINAYTKKCTQSRHPQKLMKAYKNVKFEINAASNVYQAIFIYSDFMKNEAIKSGIDSSKIKKIPSPQYDHFDDKIKLIQDKITLIYTGRLSKQKGVKYLVEAVALLKARGFTNFEVLIFGEGPDGNFLKAHVNNLNLNELISFYGWVDRSVLVDYYKKAHISVIPSTYPDNFPNSVAESMLAQLAVVAFDSGGTCEWFNHMETGVKVEHKTAKSLSEAIENLINNKDLIKLIGKNARQEILNNHSLRKTFDVYKSEYIKVT